MEALEAPITDAHLNDIARSYLERWRDLPSHLCLPQIIARDLERYCPNEERRRVSFLKTWKGKEGSKATYGRLIDALNQILCGEDAENVRRLATSDTLTTG